MSGAYYNEIDKNAAAWLRELIRQGHIAPGDVDERSIRDVKPDEIKNYTQCHFFAGIGGWSYAARLAGWPDERPLWTGSCPCQPFSGAGKRESASDDRHLWPSFNALIAAVRPIDVAGEQVASKDGLAWLGAVQADMEAAGYSFGAIDLCAAGIGAPHIRQRAFWVGHTESGGRRERGNAAFPRGGGYSDGAGGESPGSVGRKRLANSSDGLFSQQVGRSQGRDGARSIGEDNPGSARGPGPLNGFWRDADWLRCRDGKWRAVEPGTFPLGHGIPARVGRLRGYGNAIIPQIGAEVLKVLAEFSDGGA